MISKLLTITRTPKSQPKSQSDELMDLHTLNTMSDIKFWDDVGLLSFKEIRKRVYPSVSDKSIEDSLKSRFKDINFWHHMSESTIRKILTTIKMNHRELSDEVFSVDSIIRSAKEDDVYIKQIRQELGLKEKFKIDNSLLIKVSAEFR